MRLQELELIGFKSFGEKTRLRIDPRFTAIVGPNGSGKSNIVDAIRWLLGEQSHKQLRTPDSSEVLFQGAVADDRMNFAQVQMVLHASRGEDFDPEEDGRQTALTIGRRYERDGSNHYLINGQKARLKDLRATLAEYGFGLNAMSILSQGRIDAVLSLQPTERRVILEEVAQIHGFQLNKERTLEKIAQTNDNLDRLKDVQREVAERMAELQQQALAARRHGELTTVVRERERALLARDLDRRASHAQTLQRELRDAEAAVESYKGVLAQTREALDQSEAQSHALAAELAAHLQQQAELAVKATETRSAAHRLTEQEQELSEAVGRLARQEEGLAARVKDLESALTTTRYARSEAERHGADARLRAGGLETEARAHEERLTALESRAQLARQSREELAARSQRVERELAVVTERREQMAIGARELVVEIERLTAALAKLEADAALAESQRTESERVATAHRATLESAEQTVKRARTDVDQAQAQVRESAAILAARQGELKTLEELERGWEGYQAGVRALLESGTDFRLLLDRITVAPEAALALEAALGQLTQLLVAESWPPAESALEMLKERGLGRATIAIRSAVPPTTHSEPLPAGLIPLRAAIEAPAELEPLIEALTARIAIAESIDSARASGYRGLIVTREGAVLYPWGGIAGGAGESLATGIAARRGRRQQLAGECAGLADTLRRAEADATAGALVIEQAETALAAVRAEDRRLVVALAEAERSLRSARTSVAEQKRSLEILAQRQEQLERQSGLAATQGAQLAAQLQDVQAELAGMRGAQLELDLETQRQESAQIQRAAHQAQLKAQELTAQEEELTRELDRLEADLERTLPELDRVQGERKQSTAALDRLRSAAPQMQEAEQAAQRALGTSRETETRLRRDLDEAHHQVASAKSDLVGLEGDLAQAQGERESLQIRLARAEADVDSLGTSIQADPFYLERFGAAMADLPVLLASAEWRAFVEPLASAAQLKREIADATAQLVELGEINTLAERDYSHYEERHQKIQSQRVDLLAAVEDLEQSLKEIEQKSRAALLDIYEKTRANFREVFAKLFPGGEAELAWSDPDAILDSGLEIGVQLPGKGVRHLMQFSGGERTLIAIAFLFAVLTAKPPTFVLLDEVEAALDDANVEKFLQLIEHYQGHFQFVVITHNKLTMEHAPELYGVTMRKGGCSQVVSVRVQEWIEGQPSTPEAALVGV